MKISVDGKIGDIDMTVDAMLIPYLLMRLNDVGEYIVNLSDEDATSINENFGVEIFVKRHLWYVIILSAKMQHRSWVLFK